MTWSYDSTVLNDSGEGLRNRVRLLIGDTNSDDQLIQDEEIDFFLSEQSSNVFLAAADAAEAIAGGSTRYVNMSADGLSISQGFRARQYMELADRLRKKAARETPALPYAGGRSKAEAETDASDSDLIPLHFRSHIHDNPESQGSDDHDTVERW